MESFHKEYNGNDKLEHELRLELRKWNRNDTPKHIHCKESDVALPLLGIVIGDTLNIKSIENLIKSENDSKFDILNMPISNHSIENNLEKFPFTTNNKKNIISNNNNNDIINNNKSKQIKNYTNIIVEKNESPAVQFIQNSNSIYTPIKKTISGEENNLNVIVEKKSRLRIKIEPNIYSLIENKLFSIPFIPLHLIKRRDEAGRWYTIGIMVGKSSLKKTIKGDKYAMIQLGNLKETITNIFLFGNNIEKLKDKKIGQVLAVCHAKTMIPAEKNSSIALNIDNESEIYTLGNSIDLCFCKEKKSNGKPCNTPLDKRESEICEYHIVSNYKKFRNKRQEFANGNFRFTLEQNNQNSLKKSINGTYHFNESTISTFDGKLKLSQYNKNDKTPQISEEDTNFLKRLKQNNSYGINLLKKIGVNSKIEEINRSLDKKREEKLLNIHPPEALLKMGIRAPVKKSLNESINKSKTLLGDNIKKEIILDFNDNNLKKTILNNKRKIEISFLSDDENEEEEKNHFKKFLEMKKKKRKNFEQKDKNI